MNRIKCLIIVILSLLIIIGCGKADDTNLVNQVLSEEPKESEIIKKTGSMELKYASQFSVDYYEDGYIYIKVLDGNEYVIIPKGANDNNLGFENATLLHKPLDSIYLSATASMDLFRELKLLDRIKSCSTKASDYSINEAAERIDSGLISYVGKYSAPDYEKLIKLDTDLAIESTMIYHSPKVKEELEALDIPVFVERSSYEEHPLGRLEWIKLIGVLCDEEDSATKYFDTQSAKAEGVINDALCTENIKKPLVVFFYISSNGYVNVRKPGDYISKMIEMAGGDYALKSIEYEENAMSTMNVSWEDFYTYASEADILIYNSTIDGGIKSKEELLSKNELFDDFKAIKSDKIYVSNNNMFQETSKMATIMVELKKLINGDDNGLIYIRRI